MVLQYKCTHWSISPYALTCETLSCCRMSVYCWKQAMRDCRKFSWRLRDPSVTTVQDTRCSECQCELGKRKTTWKDLQEGLAQLNTDQSLLQHVHNATLYFYSEWAESWDQALILAMVHMYSTYKLLQSIRTYTVHNMQSNMYTSYTKISVNVYSKREPKVTLQHVYTLHTHCCSYSTTNSLLSRVTLCTHTQLAVGSLPGSKVDCSHTGTRCHFFVTLLWQQSKK